MGRAQARIATAATLTAVYAAWHLTGGMHGTVIRLHTPSDTALTTTVATTSQCQDLAATPAATTSTALSATPTPSPSASPAQLCISVQAAQNHATRGTIATWTIQIWDQSGPASSVTIAVTASAGLAPLFTGSCPSGGGTSTCALGDMGTSVTPLSYQLQVQVTIPAATSAQSLTLTAQAGTTPSLPASPAAGQTITIIGTAKRTTPKPKPTPSRTRATHPAIAPPVSHVAPPPPVTAPAALPTIGALPTPASVTTTVPAGSISTVLPQITPDVATATAPAVISSTGLTSPAANIQNLDTSSGPAPASQAFSFSIGMSARTAQVLGFVLLVLVFVLTVAKLTSSHLARTRQPTALDTSATKPSKRLGLAGPRLTRLRLRPRSNRTARAQHADQAAHDVMNKSS